MADMQQALQVGQIYVIHVWNGFEERRQRLEADFRAHGLEWTYILEGDIADLTEEILTTWFAPPFNIPSAGSSCVYKHLRACMRLLESNHPNALIFEDDAILASNFNAIFNQSIQEVHHLPTNIPLYISYENSGLDFIPASEQVPGQVLYERKAGRCAGAYLINRAFASLTLDYARNIRCSKAIDWVHNDLFAQHPEIKAYWCEPAIAEQGSHNGLYASSLESTPSGWLRKLSFVLQKWARQWKAKRK